MSANANRTPNKSFQQTASGSREAVSTQMELS